MSATTPDTGSKTYSLEGSSGSPLDQLRRALHDRNIAEDAPIRAYLPAIRPNARNTCERLRTTLHSAWRDARLEGRVKLFDASLDDRDYRVEIHASGSDERGSTLSSQRYHLHAQFGDDGQSLHCNITPVLEEGATDEAKTLHKRGCGAIRSAWCEAELTLSSKQWSDAWNRMHTSVRSIKTTSMNYLCYHPEQIALADEFVAVAQTCKIRAYRHDQPQFVVAEQLREMIEAELKEAQERLQGGDGRASTALCRSRLERVSEMSEMLVSLKSLLGGLSESLEASVEVLRSTWSEAQAEGAPRQRALREMVALTPQGREWMSDVAPYLEDGAYTLTATDRARENIGALLALSDLPEDAQRMIEMTHALTQRLVRFDFDDASTIQALQEQGFVAESVIEPAQTRAIYESLAPLLDAPQEASSIDISALPTDYHAGMIRTFTE